ncbi:MAG: hypothetical protein BECKG1743E_GA0114224_112332 [Candidatus Kentron sp. G]|nr:MAG: hypothetical protein BECKG1743E_GA0114224_112332 [Candidatus Kentron sp. G]
MVLSKPWPFWLAVASAGYLFTLAVFAVLGDNNRPADSSLRIATALAMGAAVVFTVYALHSGDLDPSGGAGEGGEGGGPNGGTDDGNSLISRLFPLFGVVLAVLLVIITLIANRVEHARDAAERAKTEAEIAGAKTMLIGQLLERMQMAKYESIDLKGETGQPNEGIFSLTFCKP